MGNRKNKPTAARCVICAIVLNVMASSVIAQFDKQLEMCLGEILYKHFPAKSTLVYDARLPMTYRERPLISRTPDVSINKILRNVVNNSERAVLVSDRTHQYNNTGSKFKRVKPQSSIFIVDEEMASEWNKMSELFQRIKKTEYWNRQGRTIILTLRTNSSSSREQMALNMLGSNWKWNKAVNVLAICAERRAFYMYLWYPYRRPGCKRPFQQPAYEIWRRGIFLYNRKELFPEKIKNNLEGCELDVVTDECYPYEFEEGGQMKGIEWALIKTLSKKMNFTMKNKILGEGESVFTTTYENGTTAGAFALLEKQEADLVYNCLMINLERFSLAESLPIYFYDSLSWFVPTPDKKSHASNVFEAFPADYWLYIFITTVAATACFLLIVKVDDFVLRSEAPQSLVGAAMRVFAITLFSPFTVATKNLLLRAFTFAFAMYSLHITTIYQASLYNLYRSNTFINVYQSFDQCIDKNLLVWLRTSTKNLYVSDEKEENKAWIKVMQPGHHAYIDDPYIAWNQTAYGKSSIFLFVKSTMMGFIHSLYLDERRQPQIRYLQDQFASYPVTIFLSKGHPLTSAMTLTIQQIIAAGLIPFWLSQVVRYERESESALASDVSLKLEHISGAFMFYAALICLSAGIFVVELIYWLTHGKKASLLLDKEERSMRRQLIFRAVVDISRDRFNTRLSRFRSHTTTNNNS